MPESYVTMNGRKVELSKLHVTELGTLRSVLQEYLRNPEWSEFANSWHHILSTRCVPPESALYRICEDLEGRLGVAQGKALPPDYRYCVLDLIQERYGSRAQFCKETGIEQGQLRQALAQKSDFSMTALTEVLSKLDASIQIRSNEDIAKDPQELYRQFG